MGSSTSRWSGHIAFVDTRHGLLDTVRENVEFKYVLNKHASESNSASKKKWLSITRQTNELRKHNRISMYSTSCDLHKQHHDT